MDVEAVIHTLNTAMYTYYRHKNFIVKADQNDATSQHAHIEQKHNELLHGRRRKERKERKKKKSTRLFWCHFQTLIQLLHYENMEMCLWATKRKKEEGWKKKKKKLEKK